MPEQPPEPPPYPYPDLPEPELLDHEELPLLNELEDDEREEAVVRLQPQDTGEMLNPMSSTLMTLTDDKSEYPSHIMTARARRARVTLFILTFELVCMSN